VVVVLAAAALLSGCAGTTTDANDSDTSAGVHVPVVLNDAGCTASQSSAPAGSVTFDITNSGSNAVTEVELQRNGRIVAEKENITPGLTGRFSVTLQPGGYELNCPGGSGPANQPFTVTPSP
jgi:iron uptake system component EfeO